jgi:hypothetical protein
MIDSESAFPSFLFIDTPDTAGIDHERLIPATGKIGDFLDQKKIFK